MYAKTFDVCTNTHTLTCQTDVCCILCHLQSHTHSHVRQDDCINTIAFHLLAAAFVAFCIRHTQAHRQGDFNGAVNAPYHYC